MSGSKVDAKVVLLGKEFGGKTSLVERYLHNRFTGDIPYQNTIGAAYGAARAEVAGRKVVLGIWDTAGSERYQAMSRIYYRNAWAALVCYDLTEISSWEKAKFWAEELRQQEPNARIYLVGTKKDLIEEEPERRQVNQREVERVSREIADGGTFETSARTGEGVFPLFLQVAADFVASTPKNPSPRMNQFSLSQSEERKSWCNC